MSDAQKISDRTDTASLADEPKPRASFARRLQTLWRNVLGAPSASDPTLLESLEEALEGRDEEGRALAPEERHMLANILSFGELRVDDVMVPRADVVAVEESDTLEEILRLYRESTHSRMPIYRETLDDPLGMVHIKDVVTYLATDGTGAPRDPFSLKAVRREVLFVPPSMPALDLLLKMQATHIHLALVIDEYGGTDGLVTIENLVEEIVGDIEDEHDTDQGPLLVKRDDGTIDADARAPIEELEDMIGLKLVDEEGDDDIETLGGLVFSLVGRVPVRGELIKHPLGLEFEVKDADPRRIKKLRIHKVEAAASSDEDGTDDDKRAAS
ncbi:CBS domain-containing protein [Parvibaculum sedimenti]|uniref:CBS domain-containing protein n=1 Tax=Parvibaculum sedimenti TaxID=2608632 RepID=A0A6N6VQF7_9HYPH|nr:hemolysin family protein [Parvibaculum sedimenti]KAB7742600.1 CBS domain-containing protein [Parvibaculum sedimenti]